MTEAEFKTRTKQIAIRIIRLVNSLPRSLVAQTLGKQLLRSGTSVGANYRAACRGTSKADVAHKLQIVKEEADESLYWIELLIDSNLVRAKKVSALQHDIGEIVAMTVASIKTLRRGLTRNLKSKIQNKQRLPNEKLDRIKHDSGRRSAGCDEATRGIRVARECFSRAPIAARIS